MKIRMLRTINGSPNGTHVLEYKKDEEYVVSIYPLPFELAEVFLQSGAAEQIKEALPGPRELKDDRGSSSGLSQGDVPETASRRNRQKRGMTDALGAGE